MVSKKASKFKGWLYVSALTLLAVDQGSALAATASHGSSEPVAHLYGSCGGVPVPGSFYLEHEDEARMLTRSKAVGNCCYPSELQNFTVINTQNWCKLFYCGWGCQVLTAGVTVTAEYACD